MCPVQMPFDSVTQSTTYKWKEFITNFVGKAAKVSLTRLTLPHSTFHPSTQGDPILPSPMPPPCPCF